MGFVFAFLEMGGLVVFPVTSFVGYDACCELHNPYAIRMWLLQIHSATRGLDVSGRILGEEVTRFFGAAAGRHRLFCVKGG